MLVEQITSPSTNLSSPKLPTPLESSKSTRLHQDTRDLGPKRISDANRVGTYAPSSIFMPCVFMVLQIPPIATSFLSHLYKTGGVRGRPVPNQNGKASRRLPTGKMRNLQRGTRLPTASHLSTQPSEATNVFPPRCDRGNR
jgi:hypothetical protein